MKKQSLLPIGFYDLLFDEAEKNHKNINNVIDLFLSAKYRLFKAPLVEFEDGFLKQESQNYFRTIDVFSGKNLVFRNDITPQISRILNSRLQDEKLPLKLCYVGDVLCAKNDDLYKDRQQTQVGVEIIGCDEEESNFEIIKILLEAILKLKQENVEKELLIEFSLPNFLEIFLEELQLESEELKEAIVKKNISKIRDLAGEKGEIIIKIMLSNHNLKFLEENIFALTKSIKIIAEINRAKKIVNFLEKQFPNINNSQEIKVCFDLFGDSKDSYHQDIAFDVFYGDLSYPIARGGRYKINIGDEEINSVGATIYMNLLRKV